MSKLLRGGGELDERNVTFGWQLVVQCLDTSNPVDGGAPVMIRAYGVTPASAVDDAIETVDELLVHYERIRSRLVQERDGGG